MHHVRVGLDGHERVDVDRPVAAHAAQVVAAQVDEHHVLGALLLVGQQLGGDALVGGQVAPARARAGDRPRRHVRPGHRQQRLGRGAGHLEVAEVQEVHVRRRVDGPQPAVDRERLLVDRRAPALRGHRLEDVAGVAVLDDPRHVGLELLAWHVRLPLRLRTRARRPARRRHRPGQALAHLVDHARVAAHGHDGDRVLEVVEGDQRVGQHQRHVGQADGIGVGVAQRLDRAHEVVAEVADRAAGERAAGRDAARAWWPRPPRRPARRDRRDRPATSAAPAGGGSR